MLSQKGEKQGFVGYYYNGLLENKGQTTKI